MTASTAARAASVLCACFALAAPAASAATRCAGESWTGAWGAPPSDATPGFAGQTLREVITPSAGGRAARIELTNAYGTRPVTFTDVRLGRRGHGASVVPGTSRRVTFHGRRSVTIPRGGHVTSDGVQLSFHAFQDLVVSLYVRGATGPATEHQFASEPVTYVASGDHAADPGGRGFWVPATRWWFLDRLDVLARRPAGAVVALGDSITDGLNSTVDRPRGESDTRWPDFLARRLRRAHSRLAVVNEGISGNRIFTPRGSAYAARFGESALARARADVIGVPGVTDAIVLEGINDIGQVPQASATSLIADLERLVMRLRRSGVRVLLGTLTPSGGAPGPTYGTAAVNAVRQAVNDWIRHNPFGVPVVDFDRILRDPAAPARLRPAFDSGDHVHPNARGYAAMGRAIPLRRLAAPSCGGPSAVSRGRARRPA